MLEILGSAALVAFGALLNEVLARARNREERRLSLTTRWDPLRYELYKAVVTELDRGERALNSLAPLERNTTADEAKRLALLQDLARASTALAPLLLQLRLDVDITYLHVDACQGLMREPFMDPPCVSADDFTRHRREAEAGMRNRLNLSSPVPWRRRDLAWSWFKRHLLRRPDSGEVFVPRL